MPLSNYSLDKFVAQRLSEFTSPAIDKGNIAHISTDGWISSFVLNSIFKVSLDERGRRFAFAWLRRASAAIDEYKIACAEMESAAGGRNKIDGYFKALNRVEHVVALSYQANDYARRALKSPLFATGDGSILQRLNEIYNLGRHTDLEKLPDGQIHPVWLTNEGVCCQTAVLKYSELESVLKALAEVAIGICKMSPKPSAP